MTGCHCYLHSFLLRQPRLCCPTYCVYALTGWCWHRNCSSSMSYTNLSSHISEVECLNRSFKNTISEAGDLVRMPPLDSIQSTPHLFWYNYLLSPRFIAVVERGMRWTPVRRYTEIETIAFTKFWVVLIVIGIVGEEHVSGSMHIFHISKHFKQLCLSGVSFSKKKYIPLHISYLIYFP